MKMHAHINASIRGCERDIAYGLSVLVVQFVVIKLLHCPYSTKIGDEWILAPERLECYKSQADTQMKAFQTLLTAHSDESFDEIHYCK